MRATPIQTAVTGIVAVAVGLLSAWYVPAFALSIAVGVLWYLAVIGAAAKILHLAPGQHIADTTRFVTRVAITTVTFTAGLLLNWLTHLDHVVATAQAQTTTRTVRSTVA
jgi:hypothetical protein